MPTKFVVLWLQTVFIDSGSIEVPVENETVLQSKNLNSLEDALQFYNKKSTDDTIHQVMLLVPLKDFNRTTK